MTKRIMTVVLATSLIVLAALPAIAAHTSKQTAVPNDPFALYDAQLKQVASDVLDQANQPAPAAPESAIRAGTAEQSARVSIDGARPAFSRVAQLRPVIDPILRDVGVPTELAAVVLVESGGQPTALSPKGARGLWQLMPDTARRYGLVVEPNHDDRLDVAKSTRAAAEYLRDLYSQFQDWSLALAAYNAGEQAVYRAITKTGVRAFPFVSEALPRETRNYVPAVLNITSAFGHSLGAGPTTYKASGQVVYAAAVD